MAVDSAASQQVVLAYLLYNNSATFREFIEINVGDYLNNHRHEFMTAIDGYLEEAICFAEIIFGAVNEYTTA